MERAVIELVDKFDKKMFEQASQSLKFSLGVTNGHQHRSHNPSLAKCMQGNNMNDSFDKTFHCMRCMSTIS